MVAFPWAIIFSGNTLSLLFFHKLALRCLLSSLNISMAPVQSDRNKKPYSVCCRCWSKCCCLNCLQRPRRSDGFWLHDPVSSTKPRNATDLPSPAAPNTKLIVSNLHYEITPKDLVVRSLCRLKSVVPADCRFQSIFGQVGTLVREPHIRVR